jgi:lipoprotein-anchoring transpeptidase ErfK/SrfK
MFDPKFIAFTACAFIGAALPAKALPLDSHPDAGYAVPQSYYQPDQAAVAAPVARRAPGVRLNLPFAQWSNDAYAPPPAYQNRAVRTPDARTWYVPAPEGAVRRYASTGLQPNEYYYPQDAYQQRRAQPEAYDPRLAGQKGLIDPRFRRQFVNYQGNEKRGTVIIDTQQRFLFLVLGDGMAMRYGIGVGRPGFEWAGVKTISRKAEWPDWTPPDEMLERRADLPRFMPGGPGNPLGARALYLGSSLYRIHGTNEPQTIGRAVSSGCIRMVNDDVIDLYNHVRVGTKVIVI